MSLLSIQREGVGTPFVWLHGFTQTRASAHQFRSILAGTNEVWTLDLPGHGTASSLRGSLDEIADLVARSLPSEPIALGGYSFGARVALHVALRHPERLDHLVVLGASRGIEDPDERAARRGRDELLAARIEAIGTETFLDEWLAQPLLASSASDPLERRARSTNANGLAASLREAGTGTQQWLGPELALLRTATLALSGERDTKFRGEANAIAHGVQHGSFDVISDVGHAAHLEAPERTARRIASFLNH